MTDESSNYSKHASGSGKPESVVSTSASRSEQTLQVAVSATFTAEPLQAALEFWLGQLNYRGQVTFAPYHQVFQQLLDPTSALGRNAGGVNLILIRFEDWLRFSPARTQGAVAAPEQEFPLLSRSADELIDALENYAKRAGAPTVLWFGSPSPQAERAYGAVFPEIEARVKAAVGRFANFYLLDADTVDLYPVAQVYDAKRDQLGHIPYTPLFFTTLGTALARRIHAIKAPPIKVIALDCDNTLWNGVVGEDGPRGVVISDEKRLFHRALIRQQQNGVLLCLLSKNAEEDALAVFDQRPDMELKREHLVGWRINWLPKSENIASLAQELNLGLDSFVFIDDNPVECAEMRAARPQVLTMQFPQDKEINAFVDHVWVFDRLQVTEEDRQRTIMYQQNSERTRLEQNAGDIGDFIAGLGLQIEIGSPTADQIPRVSQLTQRTNQFNFTTVRRSEAQVQQLGQAGLECLRVHVNDRFGDYGLVGVMVFGQREAALHIDTFLVSCRVLGRGVEHAMLAHLGKVAQGRGLERVEARFVPTKKNQPALNFLRGIPDVSSREDETGTCYFVTAAIAAELAYRPGSDAKKQLEFARTGGGKVVSVAGTVEAPAFDRSALMQRIATEWREIRTVHAAIAHSLSKSRPELEMQWVAPRNPVEQELVEIWQNLLSVDRVGVKDDFSALGGTSLLAVQLFVEIEERFGVHLPITAILDAPTPEQLAVRLTARQSESGRAARCLRAGTDSRRNLFLVHDGDGETLLYMNLARALPENISVWGLDPLSTVNIPIKHTRIVDMAAYYLEQITRIQPAGPYFLGGMCAGGVIAFEIASQLEAQGHWVAMVALLDSADSQAARQFALQTSRRARRFLASLQGKSKVEATARSEAPKGAEASSNRLQTAAFKLRNVAEYEWTSRTKHISDYSRFMLFRQTLDRQLEIPPWLEHLSVRTVYELAERGYQPTRRLRGGAVLFRATRGEGDDEPFIRLYRDPRLGWDQRVETPLQVIDVPGGHASMLQKPHATVLAQRMEECIERGFAAHTGKSANRASASNASAVPVAFGNGRAQAGRVWTVIVNYKSRALTVDCLKSLAPEVRKIPGSHVVVVENASGEADALTSAIVSNGWQDWVTLDVSERNGGFAYANNRAISLALQSPQPPKYIHLLNPDTRIHPGAVQALLDFMDLRTEVGIAGSSFENGDGTDWPIAFRFPSVWSELDRGLQLGIASKWLQHRIVARRMGKEEAQVDWVPGASMMVRTQVFRDIGLMDDAYFLYFEETDFCLRAHRAGWPCWYVPQSRVVHIAGQSTGVTKRYERPPRTPAYCFDSRNRYFIKNHGLPYALGADLTFGVSFGLYRIRRAIQGKPDTDPPRYLTDFIRHSVVFPRNRNT